MPTGTEFFTEISKRAGLDDAAITAALATMTDIDKLTIPEAISGAAYSSLMNLEQAKGSSDLNTFFKAKNFDGLDRELKKIVEDIADPQLSADFVNAKTTSQKQKLVIDRTKELTESKVRAEVGTKKPEKDEYEKRIQLLMDEKTRIENDLNGKYNTAVGSYKDKLSALELRQLLSKHELANPTDPDVDFDVNHGLIRKKATEKGAIIVWNEETGKHELKSASAPEMNYQENFKDVGINDFAVRTLTEAKRLKVSGVNPPTTTPQPRFAPTPGADPAKASIAAGMRAAAESAKAVN